MKHAKRKTMKPEDVLLCVRRNPSLILTLTNILENQKSVSKKKRAASTTASKKKKKEKEKEKEEENDDNDDDDEVLEVVEDD